MDEVEAVKLAAVVSETGNAAANPRSFRLALLDLTRLTEELAILGTAIIGVAPEDDRQPWEIRTLVANAFFWCLQASVSAPFRVATVDPLWVTLNEELGRGGQFHVSRVKKGISEPLCNRLKKAFGQVGANLKKGVATIDLIVKPISGLPELTRGRPGAMVIVAGGTEGCFKPLVRDFVKHPTLDRTNPDLGGASGAPAAMSRDLIVCSQNKNVIREIKDTINRNTPVGNAGNGQRLHKSAVLEEVVKKLVESKASIATMADGSNAEVRRLLQGKQHHELSGAPDGTAMLAMSPKHSGVDAFIGITRRASTVVTAVAAKAMDAGMLALPLSSQEIVAAPRNGTGKLPAGKPRSISYHYLLGAARPLGPEDFLASDDVFVIATGITAHPLLEGVQLEESSTSTGSAAGNAATHAVSSPKRVQTHTLVLNGRSGTIRTIHHTRDLDRDHFYAAVNGNTSAKKNTVPDSPAMENAAKVYESFSRAVAEALESNRR